VQCAVGACALLCAVDLRSEQQQQQQQQQQIEQMCMTWGVLDGQLPVGTATAATAI
jgi:hypothetical protein